MDLFIICHMRGRALPLVLLPVLAGCGDPITPSLLRDGCYHADNGIAVLRVAGDRGEVLVPGDVGEVRLIPRRGRDGDYVEIYPGFTVSSPVTDASRIGPPEITTRFAIRPGEAGPTILANLVAYGETPLRFGPCRPSANRPAR